VTGNCKRIGTRKNAKLEDADRPRRGNVWCGDAIDFCQTRPIDIGGTKVAGGLVDARGEIHVRSRTPMITAGAGLLVYKRISETQSLTHICQGFRFSVSVPFDRLDLVCVIALIATQVCIKGHATAFAASRMLPW